MQVITITYSDKVKSGIMSAFATANAENLLEDKVSMDIFTTGEIAPDGRNVASFIAEDADVIDILDMLEGFMYTTVRTYRW